MSTVTVAIKAEESQLSGRMKKALACQLIIRAFTHNESKIFIERGLWLWRMRTNNLWQELSQDKGYQSFDDWCSDPEQNLNPSSAYLAAQTIDVFVVFFHIRPDALHKIGERKLQALTPYISKTMIQLSNKLGCRDGWDARAWKTWNAFRDYVLEWIADAEALSATDLSDLIAYKGKGTETFFRGKVTVGMLRAAGSIEKVLDMLSISDLPDQQVLNIVLKGQKGIQQQEIEHEEIPD